MLVEVREVVRQCSVSYAVNPAVILSCRSREGVNVETRLPPARFVRAFSAFGGSAKSAGFVAYSQEAMQMVAGPSGLA